MARMFPAIALGVAFLVFSLAADETDAARSRNETIFRVYSSRPTIFSYDLALRRQPNEADGRFCTTRKADRLGPERACHLEQTSFGGGGVGAMMGILLNFISVSVTSGCDYVHTPLPYVGHGENNSDVEEFFNLGANCMQLPQLLQQAPDLELVGTVKEPTNLPVCRQRKGVVCRIGRVKKGRMRTRLAQSIADLALFKYYRHYHDLKEIQWFSPFASPENAEKRMEKDGSYSYTITMNIVFHIRRGDVSATKSASRFTSDDAVTAVIREAARNLRDLRTPPPGTLCAIPELAQRDRTGAPNTPAPRMRFRWHLASLGDPSDFPLDTWNALIRRELGDPDAAFEPQLNGRPLSVFAHFVDTDLLIFGMSSFPGLAATYYNRGVSRSYQRKGVGAVAPETLFVDPFASEVRDRACKKMLAIEVASQSQRNMP